MPTDLDETKNTFNMLLVLLLHRKKTIIAAMFSCVAVVVLWSYIMPTSYSSTVSMLPQEQKSQGGLAAILQTAAPILPSGLLGGNDSKNPLLSSDVIGSYALAKRIVEQLRLDTLERNKSLQLNELIEEVRLWYTSETKKSGVTFIEVSYPTTYFPNELEKKEAALYSAKVANTVLLELDRMLREKSMSTAKRTRQFIDKMLESKKRELDTVQSEIEEFQKKNKVLGLDSQTEAIVTNTASIGTELARAEVELGMLRSEYQATSPLVKSAEQQVEKLREQYNRVQSGGLVSFDKFSVPLENVPTLTRQYVNFVRRQKILEQVTAYLETQRLQESIQENRDLPVVQVLDQAIVPRYSSSPKRALMVGLAAFASFALSSLWIILFGIKKLNRETSVN